MTANTITVRLLILALASMAWVSSCRPALAKTPGIPERNAILAILGEADRSKEA